MRPDFRGCRLERPWVYETCKAAPDLRPDLVVGHSGFGTTMVLPEFDVLRACARNAMILLDLDACAAGYTPTRWQRSLLPDDWNPKVEVIHDGIDS